MNIKMVTVAETLIGTIVPFGPRSLTESGGAKLSRIYQHLGKTFVVLTAYRHEFSEEENIKRNARMISAFVAHGLGGIQMVGHWQEIEKKDGEPTGRQVPVEERSFFIPLNPRARNMDGTPMTPADLLDLTETLAKRYGQEAFIFGDEKGVFALDLTTGQTYHIGDTSTLNQQDLSDVYSVVKNRKFKFGFKEHIETPFVIEGYVAPKNSTQALIMTNKGLYP